jgi:hypothetical protein
MPTISSSDDVAWRVPAGRCFLGANQKKRSISSARPACWSGRRAVVTSGSETTNCSRNATRTRAQSSSLLQARSKPHGCPEGSSANTAASWRSALTPSSTKEEQPGGSLGETARESEANSTLKLARARVDVQAKDATTSGGLEAIIPDTSAATLVSSARPAFSSYITCRDALSSAPASCATCLLLLLLPPPPAPRLLRRDPSRPTLPCPSSLRRSSSGRRCETTIINMQTCTLPGSSSSGRPSRPRPNASGPKLQVRPVHPSSRVPATKLNGTLIRIDPPPQASRSSSTACSTSSRVSCATSLAPSTWTCRSSPMSSKTSRRTCVPVALRKLRYPVTTGASHPWLRLTSGDLLLCLLATLAALAGGFAQKWIVAPPPRQKFFSDEDTVVLEDESGRVQLVGARLASETLVTGALCYSLAVPTAASSLTDLPPRAPTRPSAPPCCAFGCWPTWHRCHPRRPRLRVVRRRL